MRFVAAHHVHHWVEGGATSVDNLILLCSYHHRLLHEGGYRIRRDHHGDYYFVRADGRAIPRCGYRVDDYTDDVLEDPSMECAYPKDADRASPSIEGAYPKDMNPANPSMEVREARAVYRLRPQLRAALR